MKEDLFKRALLSELRNAFPEWAAYLKGFPVLIPSPRKPPDPLVIDISNGDTIYILPACAHPLEYVLTADETLLRLNRAKLFEHVITVLKDFTGSKTVVSIGKKWCLGLPWGSKVSLVDREKARTRNCSAELISWTGQFDRPPREKRRWICGRGR